MGRGSPGAGRRPCSVSALAISRAKKRVASRDPVQPKQDGAAEVAPGSIPQEAGHRLLAQWTYGQPTKAHRWRRPRHAHRVAGRAGAQREQNRDRLVFYSTNHEREHLGGGCIQPLDVVDRDHQRGRTGRACAERQASPPTPLAGRVGPSPPPARARRRGHGSAELGDRATRSRGGLRGPHRRAAPPIQLRGTTGPDSRASGRRPLLPATAWSCRSRPRPPKSWLRVPRGRTPRSPPARRARRLAPGSTAPSLASVYPPIGGSVIVSRVPEGNLGPS